MYTDNKDMKNIQRRYGQIVVAVVVGMFGSLVVFGNAKAVMMPTPSVTWDYPNTVVELEIGHTYPLQWMGMNPNNENVIVSLGLERVGAHFDAGNYGAIAMGYPLPLTGSFAWKAGYAGSSNDLRMADGDYHLVVILYSLTQGKEIARDYSDDVITLVSQPSNPAPSMAPPQPLTPWIEVLSPSGGEHWVIGNTTTVAWQAMNPIAGNYVMSLGFERVGGHFETGGFGILKGDTKFPLSGTYEWPVGMTGSDGTLAVQPGEYRLAAVLYSLKLNKELARGYSSGTFMIDAPTTPETAAPSGTGTDISIVQENKTLTDNVVATPDTAQVTISPVSLDSVIPPAPRDASGASTQDTLIFLQGRVRVLQDQLTQLQKPQIVSSEKQVSSNGGFDKNLRFGIKGDADVLTLQATLTREGVYRGPITGNFLNLTRIAVKDFQKKYGIEQTGFVGPLTRTKLSELVGN